MATALRISGFVAFALDIVLVLLLYRDHHSGAWFSGAFDDLAYSFIGILTVFGLVFFGIAKTMSARSRDSMSGLGLNTESDNSQHNREQR